MKEYKLTTTTLFERNSKKLVKKNPNLKPEIKEILKLLKTAPFHRSLRTHQVNLPTFGKVWSSRVTKNQLSGDLRLLWRQK